MTTPTLREALEWNAEVLIAQSGRTSDSSTFVLNGQKKTLAEVMEMARTALAAQPELPEHVSGVVLDEDGSASLIRRGTEADRVARRGGSLLYTAAHLQQAQAKREPMTEDELAGALESAGIETQYVTDALRRTHWFTMGSINPMRIARAIEAHLGIGDKA